MSDTTPGTPAVLPDWREQLRRLGKSGFLRGEMIRLGFWPPADRKEEEFAAAETALKALYDELSSLNGQLEAVETQIRESGDIAKLLAEVRRRRIERVRAERATRRAERQQALEEKRAKDKAWRAQTLPFLGRGVSGGLTYEGGDAEKVAAAGLPALSSASDVAAAIGITERELAWLTYHRGAAAVDHYHRFTIPKKRGGSRVISSPKKRLRVAQRWLLESVLIPLPVHAAATAFRPGTSIVDNAVRHAGRDSVVRIDLKDFFPSIKFGRVKNLFVRLGYNEGVATILALLATEAPRAAVTLDGQRRFVALGQRCLPQGALTSPALTNLLCRRLDARLSGVANITGFDYSRYADDLVFSQRVEEAVIGGLLQLARTVIEDEGFTINDSKTAVMRPQHRQTVTGLVVNETPRLSRRDLRRFRAFLHCYEQIGREAMTEKLGQDALAYAAGYLSFIHMVSPQQEAQIRRAHPWLERWQAH